MPRTALRGRRSAASRRAFTLIELMVVVGIIGLLIAIALPAFSAARRTAKVSATTATINVIGLGLEQFRTDAQLGGSYPPSVRTECRPPYQNAGGKTIWVGGAGLLVWALAGADLLGTPGFRNVDGNSDNDPFGGWLSDTHTNFVSGGISGLYALDPATGKPAYARSGPFVELSKMKLATKVAGQDAAFEIPTAKGDTRLRSACFLDSFDQPVLYYKANTGAPSMAASGSRSPDSGGNETDYAYSSAGQYVPTGIYNMRDNSIITGAGNEKGMDLGAGSGHFAQDSGSNPELGNVTRVNYQSDPTGNRPQPRTFQHTVWNPNVTATLRPHREDSFILLSPGPDGLFGTGDDVGNIPNN